MRYTGRRRSTRIGGFVQIIVLIGLAAVAGLLATVFSQAHPRGAHAASIERMTLGQTLAESGVRRLLVAIDDPADDLEVRVGTGGDAFPYAFAERSLKLAIEGEAGKIDLLAADRALLLGYLDDAALEQGDRASLIEALDKARKEADGAAAMEAVYAYLLPTDRAEFIGRDFTLLSGMSGIDPMYASERVLAAAPEVSDVEAVRIVRTRQADASTIAVSSRHFMSGPPVFTLVSTVQWPNSEITAVRVPVEITTGGRALVLTGFR